MSDENGDDEEGAKIVDQGDVEIARSPEEVEAAIEDGVFDPPVKKRRNEGRQTPDGE